jgi:hypothetical protein
MKYTNVYLGGGKSYCLTQFALDLGEPELIDNNQNYCYACCLGSNKDPGVPLSNQDIIKLLRVVPHDSIIIDPDEPFLRTGITARYSLWPLTREVDNSILEMFPAKDPEKECRSLNEKGLCDMTESKPDYCCKGGCIYARTLYTLINKKNVATEIFYGMCLSDKILKIEEMAREKRTRIKIR